MVTNQTRTNPDAFVRGIFVGRGSEGDAARELAPLLGISVSRARACVGLARRGANATAIDAVIADAQAASRRKSTGPQWHIAPDGSDCCCTAEDRQYGCGCS